MSNIDNPIVTIDVAGKNSLRELASFVGKTAMPRKHRSKFWNAYKAATGNNMPQTRPRRAADLLGTVLAISARTRRLVAPRTKIELDVFTPAGNRAVQLIIGHSE